MLTIIFCTLISSASIWLCIEIYLENRRFWKREREKQKEAARKWWTKDAKEYDEYINQN